MKFFGGLVIGTVCGFMAGACYTTVKVGQAAVDGLNSGAIELHDPDCPQGGLKDPNDGKCKTWKDLRPLTTPSTTSTHNDRKTLL